MLRALIVCSCIFLSTSCLATTKKETNEFNKFILQTKQLAKKRGVSDKTLHRYLDSLKPPELKHKKTLLSRKKNQAQAVLSFKQYIDRLVPSSKVIRARKELMKNKKLLLNIQRKFHVRPEYIISLWAIESNFGHYTGRFPLIKTLVTLSIQQHRSKFYQKQLVDALVMLNAKHVIKEQLLSSWAGAMGQPQFIPNSYLHYAVDFDADGFKNIWTSLPDVLASIANYLEKNHWKEDEPVIIPAQLSKPLQASSTLHFIDTLQWKKRGVTLNKKYHWSNLPKKAAFIHPKGSNASYLVFYNFKVLKRWNNTTFESLAVAILAEQI